MILNQMNWKIFHMSYENYKKNSGTLLHTFIFDIIFYFYFIISFFKSIFFSTWN